MCFDEIVVLRGNINCALFRPNLVERLVPGKTHDHAGLMNIICFILWFYDISLMLAFK